MDHTTKVCYVAVGCLFVPTPNWGNASIGCCVSYFELTILKTETHNSPTNYHQISWGGIMAGSWLLTPPPPIQFGSFHSRKHHQTLLFKNQHISSSSSSLSNTRIYCNYNTNNNDTSSDTNKKPDRNALQLYTEIERFVSPLLFPFFIF